MNEHKEFAAARPPESVAPIRPVSGRDRAALGSSGGSESCDLGRAENSKHGQPRESRAHGSDASGNPTKLGAPIERVEGPRFPPPPWLWAAVGRWATCGYDRAEASARLAELRARAVEPERDAGGSVV